jgi:D-glycero-alpha-D-manno-heptose-7-phosphate kinase
VRDHETRVLGSPAGEQDYVAAIHGGVNALHLEPGGARREALRVDAASLESRLVLVYSGRSRFSGAGNWAIVRRRVEGDRAVARRLRDVATAARSLLGALRRADWKAAGEAIRAEWAARRRLAPSVAAGGMDELVRLGRRHGALAGKVCGAGGGGCLVFLAPPGRREAVAAALEEAGNRRLEVKLARRGVRARVSERPAGRPR